MPCWPKAPPNPKLWHKFRGFPSFSSFLGQDPGAGCCWERGEGAHTESVQFGVCPSPRTLLRHSRSSLAAPALLAPPGLASGARIPPSLLQPSCLSLIQLPVIRNLHRF